MADTCPGGSPYGTSHRRHKRACCSCASPPRPAATRRLRSIAPPWQSPHFDTSRLTVWVQEADVTGWVRARCGHVSARGVEGRGRPSPQRRMTARRQQGLHADLKEVSHLALELLGLLRAGLEHGAHDRHPLADDIELSLPPLCHSFHVLLHLCAKCRPRKHDAKPCVSTPVTCILLSSQCGEQRPSSAAEQSRAAAA